MLKKFIFALIVFTILSVGGTSVLAEPVDNGYGEGLPAGESAISDHAAKVLASIASDSDETEQFVMKILKPENNTESTTEDVYAISGSANGSVRVILEVFDEASKTYVPKENIDGETFFTTGGLFGFVSEIALQEGANKIRILAYDVSKDSSLDAKDIQITKFTITRLKASIFTKPADFQMELKYILWSSIFQK